MLRHPKDGKGIGLTDVCLSTVGGGREGVPLLTGFFQVLYSGGVPPDLLSQILSGVLLSGPRTG